MLRLRRERIFLVVLVLLVALAAGISLYAYVMGGTRGAEEWFHLVGGNGENVGQEASSSDTGNQGNEPEPILVVDLFSYLVVLIGLAVVAGSVWLWYSHHIE